MTTVSPELLSRFDPHAVELQHGQPADLRETFQQFAAGTFYAQMLKSLRRTHGRAAYLDGGQAEQMFREQLDQYVADSLAERHGRAFTEPLFRTFSLQYQAAQRNAA
jgi:Rod binding domain-containing protein